jgi:hypothetical protein
MTPTRRGCHRPAIPGTGVAEAEAGRPPSSPRAARPGPPGASEAADDDENTLFTETVGYSVRESAVNAVTELDSGNPHLVLQGKELGDLLGELEPSGIRAYGPRPFHRH